MADSVKIAIQALQTKARELIQERDETRGMLLEGAYDLAQLMRDIDACVSGARVLGRELDLSGPIVIPPQKQGFANQFYAYCSNLANLYGHLKTEFGIEDEGAEASDVVDDTRPEMPRIADIILERITAAGEDGAKADDIRRFIIRTYKSNIHQKTVGMTLNRMQGAGQVHRDGRMWFLGPAPPPPAAATEAPKPAETPK